MNNNLSSLDECKYNKYDTSNIKVQFKTLGGNILILNLENNGLSTTIKDIKLKLQEK